ncbi:Retrovirus-related Pol polyprotein from transposon TNT 1-94 [Cucumis melo var. makuwa]|uniref:Retrovirus-related Pol polyprotein from transposon TNT 1-94 n=1 Tax=Cucumis melo var. makuwa TaxID=1194695 RepID=A0A5A7SST8_CUCMM|nr:Retrovirus-related Pol polyprotein from transposon TNT 1-94 [Cucumis melo var. makuwa]TYK03469.1 Retrovirus-related Pol polyprotein from transposon TNT 1-94 [Cucumis melo var. makuwa]
MKDLGEADVILGVKIRKNKTSLSLCQSHYVEKILKKFDSIDVSPVRTLFDASKHLKKNKGDIVSQPEYAKIIDNDEVNSTSGYVFLLGGGAISWKSVKQTCIARSTMESEIIALELAGQEAEWIKNLLGGVPLWGTSVLCPYSVIRKLRYILPRTVCIMVRVDTYVLGMQ